jgi:small subunit ribosomal protein S16
VATTIRLQRTGRKRQASFRIVVTDVNEQRDGPAIETLGTYNPRTQPSIVRLDAAASLNWLYEGAQPTDTVVSIFRKTGVWQKFQAGETADSLEETVVTLGPPPGEQKTSTRAAVAAEAQKLRAVEVAAARQVADEAAKQARKQWRKRPKRWKRSLPKLRKQWRKRPKRWKRSLPRPRKWLRKRSLPRRKKPSRKWPRKR